MKILFITNIPSPYRIEFFNELGKTQDVKVLFEAERARHINNNWYSDNIINNFEAVFLKNGEIEERKINWKILKHIKRSRQDIIVLTNYAYFTEMLVFIYLKTLRIPYYLEVDGGIVKSENTLKKWYKSFLISGAYGYISPSKQTDDYLLYYGAKKEKIHRYPFTSLKEIDILKGNLSAKEKDKIREELEMEENKIILSVGQFIHRKGYDILLKAAKNIDKNTGIYIVGGEPTEEYIDLKDKGNLNNVHFIGFKSKEDLKNYYKAADLFVLPTREDIWGLVINEAMAYGLPIITTNKCVAGLELVKEAENGFIIPTEDYRELEKKINDILSDDTLRNNMSRKSLEKIRKYVIENSADTHRKIFNLR